MTETQRSTPTPRTSRRRTWTAVAALLVPVVAWAASLGLSYVVQDFACSAAASADTGLSEGVLLTILLVLNAVLLVLTVLAGIGGFVVARRSRDATDAPLLVFLGYVGAGAALFFAFGIVLIAQSPIVLGVCS